MPPSKMIQDSAFIAGNPPQGAAAPKMSGKGNAPVSDAANTGKPQGSPRILGMIRESDTAFKSGLTK